MKKFFIFLILLLTGITLKAQVLQISLDTVNANPGDSISVPVRTQNFVNVGSMTLFIQFNTQVLSFGQVTNWNDQLLAGIHLANAGNNTLAIVWTDINGANIPDGKIADIRFKYLGGYTNLSFLPTCEITDIWGAAVSPPPVFINGMVKLKLAVTASAQPANICLGDSAMLNATVSGGLGVSSVSWTSDPPGFISSLTNPWVKPAIPVTYYVMATDGDDTAYSSVFVDVYDFIPPDPATNFFPANNTVNLSVPVVFSWSPALNATAYDFYIWEAGTQEPLVPTQSNITQLTFQLSTGIGYGKTYNWKIVSTNPCMQTPGEILTFSTRFLPDLVISNVNAPSVAFSGQNIVAGFTVKNEGQGSTLNASWTDKLYLSTDTTFESSIDKYLGSLPNFSSLNQGESYIQNMSFTLPQGISGYYYLIAVTDVFNNVSETNENNNKGFNTDTFLVTLSPIPDLQVIKIIIPNNIFSGQPMPLSWKVQNKGTAATSASSWYDRVYLSPDTALVASNAYILGTFQHNGILGVDSSYTNNVTINIPDYILGRYFVYIVSDFYNDVFEHALENNNSLKSDSLTVFLTPPPDLAVTSIDVVDTASKNETVSVTFTVENTGGNAATGSWHDRIYISNSLNLNTATASLLMTIDHHNGLEMDASYTETVNVVIPESVTGPNYIFVFTDAGHHVFEHTQEANNVMRSNIIQILPPDLEVDTAELPLLFNSGTYVDIPYTFINNGPGKLIDSWVDKVFVSRHGTFHADSVLLCGQVVLSHRYLGPAQTFDTTAHIFIPNGISGNYYLYIYADYYNSISENAAENNNIYRSNNPIQVNLSPWPDLTVDQINYSTDTINAGLSLDLGYRVLNQGTGPASAPPFTDLIFVSTNPFSPVNLHTVTQVIHDSVIEAGNAEIMNLSVQIPSYLGEGFYYFWIKTDYHNNIYEHTDEGNNFVRGNPIYILPYPPVDLVCTHISSPDAAASGSQITVSWQVKNQGIATPTRYGWHDYIYLSVDTIYDPSSDISVQPFVHYGWLSPGTSYIVSNQVTIPNGIGGDYYLFVVADRNHDVTDPDYNNNVSLKRDNNGEPAIIHISSTPPPDLVLMNLEIPDIVIAGQPFKVKFTVENQGTGPAVPVSWNDWVVLSSDFNISGTVRHLYLTTHSGELLPGSSYSDSSTCYVPANFQGNFIAIAYTDISNLVYEASHESNNIYTKAIIVQQPPPADLCVVNINATTNVIVGNQDNFNVSYKVRNTGLFPASGTMKDLVYLSTDTIWDVTDYLAGTLEGYISIGAGEELSRSITCTINSLSVGDYYVIIRTDVLNNIYESDDDNNTGITDITTHVDVPELPLNTLVTNTLDDYAPVYYRIEIPAALAGELLYVTLKADSVFGINEMYMRYGTSPTRTEFDFSYTNPSYGNQEIIVPFLQEGTYYLMVYGNTTQGNIQNIMLFAKKLDFVILSVAEKEGGNSGKVTVKLTGSKFTPNMSVFLVKGEKTIQGNDMIFIDQSSAYVTFDLNEADTGLYHVVANKFCGGMAMLENAFHVVSGQAPNLVVMVYQPSAMGTNGVATLEVEFTNAGNTDLVAPDCEFISLKDAPVSYTYTGLSAGLTSLVLQLREPGGPPSVLRPGMSGTITVYVKSSKALVFTLKLPNY